MPPDTVWHLRIADDDRLLGAKDARLLGADLLERIAEPVAMIKAH